MTAVKHVSQHDEWHLISSLRPRLRQGVQSRRQRFWGETWYILTDPQSNQHFRLAAQAFQFVSQLDGERDMATLWQLQQLLPQSGSSSEPPLSQGELLSLLGQLYGANLLTVDHTTDIDSLLHVRQGKQLKRFGGTLASLLFMRFPLWSPERFLNRTFAIGSWLFSPWGLGLSLLLFVWALRALLLHDGELLAGKSSLLAPGNMIWLYLTMLVTKTIHELGHAFACKYYCRRDGTQGEVTTLGIMLMIFVPMPYVDVSSSWQIRSKWARAMVGAAGMYCELILAAIATLLWVHSTPDTLLQAASFNCMIVASVTTLLFNLNPLLRFDGYYILTDLLALPNLYQRSQAYLVHLLKHYGLGLTQSSTVVSHRYERWLYPLYALAAFGYRLLITLGIFFTLKEAFFALGVLLSAGLAFLWFGLPLIKSLLYLHHSPELIGMRSKAWLRVGLIAAVLGLGLFATPYPSSLVTEGIVEARNEHLIYADTEGVLSHITPTDTQVTASQPLLATINNLGLESQLTMQGLLVRKAQDQQEQALAENNLPAAGAAGVRLEAAQEQWALLQEQWRKQQVKTPESGVWVAPYLAKRLGKWISRGEILGIVYRPGDYRLRVIVDQFDASRLFAEPLPKVEFQITGRPDLAADDAGFSAHLETAPLPSAQESIIHPALTFDGGGTIAVDQSQTGPVAAHPYFELRLLPEPGSTQFLLPGQRIVAKLSFAPQPLGLQIWRRIEQLFQGH